jgi:hypothetical protein
MKIAADGVWRLISDGVRDGILLARGTSSQVQKAQGGERRKNLRSWYSHVSRRGVVWSFDLRSVEAKLRLDADSSARSAPRISSPIRLVLTGHCAMPTIFSYEGYQINRFSLQRERHNTPRCCGEHAYRATVGPPRTVFSSSNAFFACNDWGNVSDCATRYPKTPDSRRVSEARKNISKVKFP